MVGIDGGNEGGFVDGALSDGMNGTINTCFETCA